MGLSSGVALGLYVSVSVGLSVCPLIGLFVDLSVGKSLSAEDLSKSNFKV